MKEAYFRLAKRFHPDVHHDAVAGRPARQARGRLHPPRPGLRDAQEPEGPRFLRGTARAAAARAGLAGPAAPEPPRPAAPRSARRGGAQGGEAARRAKSARPEKLYRAGQKYWDAIQLLEPAVPLVKGKLNAARPRRPRPLLPEEPEVGQAGGGGAAGRRPARTPRTWTPTSSWARSTRSAASARARSACSARSLELKPDHEEALALPRGWPRPLRTAAPRRRRGGLMKRLLQEALNMRRWLCRGRSSPSPPPSAPTWSCSRTATAITGTGVAQGTRGGSGCRRPTACS